MRLVRKIKAQSGHRVAVLKLSPEEVGAAFPRGVKTDQYTDFYVVKNWDDSGVTFFYMARGYHWETVRLVTGKDLPAVQSFKLSPVVTRLLPKGVAKEIHVWYPNGRMWSSFGTNFKEAIDGAQRDGWLHADDGVNQLLTF